MNHNLRVENRKMTVYSDYFRHIIRHYEESKERVVRYCSERGIRRVAVCMWTKAADVLATFLELCGVQIEYLISSGYNPPGLPVVSPNAQTFPDADVIIVCDVITPTRKKIQEKAKCPVISVFDILPNDEA